MVVRKILEATLVAGTSSVTFTDTDIPNSLLRVYCTRSALFPLSQTLSGNSVTVNYKPQDSNIGVALEIVKSGLDIVDDLTSEDNTKALSANQGYVLKGLIDGIVIPTVPENITDLDDVSVNNISSGQVLAWNSTSQKFENVNQSGGGGSETYSTTEQEIGTWIDGSKLYRRVVPFNTARTNVRVNTWVEFPEVDASNILQVTHSVIINFASNTPNYRVNIPCMCSTNRDAFNQHLAFAHLRPSDVTFAIDNMLIIEYTKITD